MLGLEGNRIGDDGLKALAEACRASGALAQLIRLDMDGNQIGDAGMTAFAGAVGKGALDNLELLMLISNQIGDDGISALAKAITPSKDGKGALAQGARIYLKDNDNATETGKQAMRDAAKARGLSVFF